MPRYYPKMSLRERIATPDGKRRFVRAIFATIADRYDFITVVLSYGQDRRWKRRLIDLAAPHAGARALDLATGTGDIALRAGVARRARRRSRHHVPDDRAGEAQRHASGFSRVGRRRIDRARVPGRRHAGAAVSVRLVRDRDDRVRAAQRAEPGDGDRRDRARADAGRPAAVARLQPAVEPSRARRRISHTSRSSAPRSAGCCTAIPTPTATFPASIRQYPGAEAVARLFEARGFTGVRCYPVLGGLMTIHHAIRA